MFAGFALFDPEAEQLFLGTDTELTELDPADAQLTTLATTGRTFVESVDDLTGVRAGDVRTLPGYPGPGRPTRCRGRARTRRSRSRAVRPSRARSTRIYDADAGTITDVADGAPGRLPRASRASSSPTTGRRPVSPGFTLRCRVRQLRGGVHVVGVPRAVLPRAGVEPRVRPRLRRRDVRPRTAPRRRVQRRADERAQALPLADHHPLRAARVHDRPGVEGDVQRDVRDQQVAALPRVVAVVDGRGDVLADPRQHVARLPVHVPRQHRCPAERARRPQGSGVRRRCHRVEGVPQDHLPAATRLGEPAARGQLRLQLQQLHAGLPAHRRQSPRAPARAPGRPTS